MYGAGGITRRSIATALGAGLLFATVFAGRFLGIVFFTDLALAGFAFAGFFLAAVLLAGFFNFLGAFLAAFLPDVFLAFVLETFLFFFAISIPLSGFIPTYFGTTIFNFGTPVK
jgi:hypothetical protein